ncbi:MAG: hypothetical protein NTZ09_21570 [Candidatus Hydrogenedentes bacterium]|nr:hypothetical protein [Candidatus Hydrogenedentota bacterium]
MKLVTRAIFVFAMIILSIVSMWTTYESLRESILPAPEIPIRLGPTIVWNCSIFALALSVAIGLMLYALKLAIIDEQKRLNLLGVLGLTVVGFISISFNLDVFYRWAHRDFFINYSTSRVKTAYEDYLSQTQQALTDKREELLKKVALQEGELDAEVKGLRKAPAGYGVIAKGEDYQLTLLQKTTAVELETVNAALEKKKEADTLLASSMPATLDEVEKLQHELRVVVKDVGAVSGKPLPQPVELESPLFAVFRKLFDWGQIGFEEVFFVLLAFLLDLGDIIGYSLIPNAKKKPRLAPLTELPDFLKPAAALPAGLATLPPKPEYDPLIPETAEAALLPLEAGTAGDAPQETAVPEGSEAEAESRRARRAITFRRR